MLTQILGTFIIVCDHFYLGRTYCFFLVCFQYDLIVFFLFHRTVLFNFVGNHVSLLHVCILCTRNSLYTVSGNVVQSNVVSLIWCMQYRSCAGYVLLFVCVCVCVCGRYVDRQYHSFVCVCVCGIGILRNETNF